MAFAFGWTPCIGPILGSILVLAATEESINKGVYF
jgi:cytochrome c-type biogenesis protein